MRRAASILKEAPAQAQNSRKAKRGGRASRDKGNRLERAVVRLLQDHGLGGERVPLSGSTGGSYSGDLTVPCLGRDLVVEAKARANGFRQLYAWLEGRDVLVLKADRRDALVVLPLRLAVEIAAAAAERSRSLTEIQFTKPRRFAKTAVLATRTAESHGRLAELTHRT